MRRPRFPLCFPSLPGPAAAGSGLGTQGARDLLPGARDCAPGPPISQGRGSLPSFSSSGCPGPGMAASRPLRHPLPPSTTPPRLLPPRSPDARPAGAAAVFPRPDPSAAAAPSQPAPRESAPGRGTREPLQTRPLRALAIISASRGGPMGGELRPAQPRWDPPSRLGPPRRAPLPASQFERRDELPELQWLRAEKAPDRFLGSGKGGRSGPAPKRTLTLQAWGD